MVFAEDKFGWNQNISPIGKALEVSPSGKTSMSGVRQCRLSQTRQSQDGAPGDAGQIRKWHRAWNLLKGLTPLSEQTK
jgi:hypothetical protein